MYAFLFLFIFVVTLRQYDGNVIEILQPDSVCSGAKHKARVASSEQTSTPKWAVL
jgi:hypothetical protein